MPIIAAFILEFVKKYWKYIVLAILLLSAFTYISIIFKHAHEYKIEKKEIQTQQKNIVDLSNTLQKQKDYTVDVEKNENELEQSNIDIQTNSKKETETFHKNIETSPQNISGDFNTMFKEFNDAE